MSLNRIILMGRLVKDPELRRTQSGTSVTSFRIAVDRDFKSQDGTKQADFFDVVAWRNTAEYVSKYFTKGRMAIVEGRLQSRDWTDKDGGKRVAIEVVADNIYFGDSKRDNAGSGYDAPPAYGSAPAYASPAGGYRPGAGSGFAELDDQDGELPF